MSSLVNYVCWSPDVVSSTIPTEAATPSDRVLLATHAPLRITRHGGHGGHAMSELVTERQVLDEFLESTPNNGVLVASVLGESGAGKSHLVRWVNAKIPKKAGRHVVYLQKTETSLKDVVEKLLVGQTDSEFEEIRRKVSTLSSGLTIDEMAHKLLAELAESLRTAHADNPYGKALVGEDGLRLFFTDPLFESHLLRAGSFILRRAEHALRGRTADEGDVPLEFTAEELPLDIGDYADIQDAARATQNLFRRLAANTSMQAEAVRLVNENLDVAVMKAASLAVGDIGQAFKKIREKLVGDEIILLIEDVALIQGVRRDVLDAIVEVGVVQGVQRFATVRTLMAVTPGYYEESLPETFRRRSEATSPRYVVDVDLDGATAEEDDLIDFVARYLNAARVGKDRIEAEAPHVPNACVSCPFRSPCHETFGASGQEYGLYPYNRPAVLRAIRACADTATGGGRTLFNPRKVLSRAVRNVLVDSAAVLRQGAFPPAGFLAQESTETRLTRLPIHVREQIETVFAGDDAGRLEALVTFWGAVGTEVVSDEILRAFSHPSVPASVFGPRGTPARTQDVPAQREETARRATRTEIDLPPSVVQRLEAIDAWANGQVLPQAVAAEIRSIFRDALLARIDWFDVVIKEPDAMTVNRAIPNNARTVSITGANENLPRGSAALITLARTAGTAVTFKGLVLLKEGFAERAGDALPRIDALVIGAVAEAKQRILAELEVNDEALVEAAASLIRGAISCGTMPAKASDADYINACLWRDPSPRPDETSRIPEWNNAYREYVVEREPAIDKLLNGLGAAQGSGGVHAIDFPRFAAIVRKARTPALGGSELVVPPWCKEAEHKLRALARLATRQIEHWQRLLERARVHLPAGTGLLETIDAIDAAFRDGQSQGFVPEPDLGKLAARNDAARREFDDKCLAEVERLLAGVEHAVGLDLQRAVGAVVGADLQAIVEFVEYSARWVEAGTAKAESSGGTVADADALLEDVIAQWFEIVGEDESSD